MIHHSELVNHYLHPMLNGVIDLLISMEDAGMLFPLSFTNPRTGSTVAGLAFLMVWLLRKLK